ncbi:MAG: DUF6452 family protein [Prolixibacteraceae bacterium]|jgi:hypothetical protein|nr:DUF6452 family protein [Prolixibacteraceae bacterium]
MQSRLIILLLVIMFISSCNNGSHCYESSETLLVTNFTADGKINVDSIMVRGYNRFAKGDTLVFNRVSATAVKIALPLSVSTDTTGFVVFANGRSSSFWVKHSMNFQLISQSCGFAPNYELIALRHSSLIDSIKVLDPVVNPKSAEKYATNGQNITVYLHLATP